MVCNGQLKGYTSMLTPRPHLLMSPQDTHGTHSPFPPVPDSKKAIKAFGAVRSLRETCAEGKVMCSGCFLVVLYHSNQFGSHASGLQNRRKVTAVTDKFACQIYPLKLAIFSLSAAQNSGLSRQFFQSAINKFSTSASRVTVPAELI
jgi:hypothetical protein